MKEIREMKLLANRAGGNAGKNSYNFRVSLPSSWIRQMGLHEDNRNLILEFDGKTITIKNGEFGE